MSYRKKDLTTVVGPLTVWRAYYHCSQCEASVVPKDQELGVVGTSLSPGVQRMEARTGSQEPFALASRDLRELAGISVSPKQVERVAESSGDRIKGDVEAQWAACSPRPVWTRRAGLSATPIPPATLPP